MAVDAMGGDYAPQMNINGSILATEEDDSIYIKLFGNESLINEHIKKFKYKNIDIIHTESYIEMHEKPVEGLKAKSDASIIKCMRMLNEKKIDAVVSAGNSGATMIAAFMVLKRIRGISRPAIAITIPTIKDRCVIIDVGGNVDCKAKHLIQFAIMGSIYYKLITGKKNPSVGFLNIGEEEGKGNEAVKNATTIMKEIPKDIVNFYGQVEGRDIPEQKVDVFVCDGFVGNILLKFAEGLAVGIQKMIKEEVKKRALAKLGYLLMKTAFAAFKKKADYAEYGGAPLLGVNGVVVISHGASSPKAIKNAIYVAKKMYEKGIVDEIKKEMESIAPILNYGN
ncbi:MAG: phosphate acyltransferase PlsX [bacterium]|nr:phosphate acyltransferase PlsX [bacterium]